MTKYTKRMVHEHTSLNMHDLNSVANRTSSQNGNVRNRPFIHLGCYQLFTFLTASTYSIDTSYENDMLVEHLYLEVFVNEKCQVGPLCI